jgi:hypothetical protein
MAGLSDAASELESIARHLRNAGDGELVRELTAAMRRAVEPVPGQIRAGLKPHLPDRYAGVLDADLRIGINVRTNERNPGVSVTGQTRGRGRKLARLDAGLISHPVYGNREHWATQGPGQGMEPGWFSGPAQDATPRVRAEIEKALEDVAARAASKGA